MELFFVGHMASIVGWSALALGIALVVVPLFVCVARQRSHARTCNVVWLGMVAWGGLMWFALPTACFWLTNDERHLHSLAPRGVAFIAIIAMGWLPATLLTGLVKSIFAFVHSRRAKTESSTKSSGL
jgi:uncharacterized membrane protein